MPLPSQSARTPAQPSASQRQQPKPRPRKNPTPLLLIAGGIIAIIGVTALALRSGPRPTTPQQPVLATNDPAAAPPSTVLPQTDTSVGTLGAVPLKSAPLAARTPVSDPALPPPSQPVSAPPATQPAGTPPQPTISEPLAPAIPADLQDTITAARTKLMTGDAVAARVLLSRAVIDARLPESERAILRDDLARINDDLVFSPRVDPADPFAYAYTIQPGDSLVRIDQREKLGPDWRFIQRVNAMSSPSRLTVGKKLKLVRGPFHAVVSKSAYRLDLYMGDAAQPSELVFVRSFRVGLGEGNSTPLGEFRVRPGSKLVNPHWVNPRTGEKFAADDPKNPIGEHWIGLEGIGQYATITGYGIHGTIEPDSIGQQRSMGCVRLGTEDIALLYEVLTEGGSTVRILP